MWYFTLKTFYLFESKILDGLQLYEGLAIPSAIKFQVQIIFCLFLSLSTLYSHPTIGRYSLHQTLSLFCALFPTILHNFSLVLNTLLLINYCRLVNDLPSRVFLSLQSFCKLIPK